jgi:hypothetical protein
MSTLPQAMRDRRLLGILAVALIVLAVRAAWYVPWFADDSFISLRYSQRLLEGHGLTWNDGERVEGYSNLLWVLLCAAAGRTGIELVLASRILGVTITIGIFAAIVFAHRRTSSSLLAVATALIALAASNPVAVWSIGGLEQPLLSCLLVWAVACLLRDAETPQLEARSIAPGLLLALVTLTRPDGIALAASVALAAALVAQSMTSAPRLMLLPAIAWLGQLVFRLAYYGDWVPNTARVKVAWTAAHFWHGAEYVGRACLALTPLVAAIAGCVWLLRGPSRRNRLLLLVVPAGAWTAYLLFIGGDIFPAHRQFEPVAVLGALCAIEWLSAEWERFSTADMRRLAWSAAFLALLAVPQALDPDGARAKWERWEWTGQRVGEFLSTAFAKDDPLIAVDAAGAVPYYSGLHTLDMLGLNDRWLATHPSRDAQGEFGHEIGDGAYVLSRQPDIIMMGIPPGQEDSIFRGDEELAGLDEFHRDYHLLYFDLGGSPPLVARLWVRDTSEKVGIRAHGDQIIVPGQLLARGHLTMTSLDADGHLGTRIFPGREARVTGLRLAPGLWTVKADASSPVSLRVARPEGIEMTVEAGVNRFVVPEGVADLDLKVKATEGVVSVRSLSLTRAAAVSTSASP